MFQTSSSAIVSVTLKFLQDKTYCNWHNGKIFKICVVLNRHDRERIESKNVRNVCKNRG